MGADERITSTVETRTLELIGQGLSGKEAEHFARQMVFLESTAPKDFVFNRGQKTIREEYFELYMQCAILEIKINAAIRKSAGKVEDSSLLIMAAKELEYEVAAGRIKS